MHPENQLLENFCNLIHLKAWPGHRLPLLESTHPFFSRDDLADFRDADAGGADVGRQAVGVGGAAADQQRAGPD